MRFVFSVLPLSFCLVLAACSSDDDNKKSSSPAPSSTSATDPGPAKGGKASGGDLGPQCTKYLECCDELVKDNPQVGASCDTVKKSITDTQKKGQSTDTLESACKQGVSGFQAAGYCK